LLCNTIILFPPNSHILSRRTAHHYIKKKIKTRCTGPL
jgi:hypothetical protein